MRHITQRLQFALFLATVLTGLLSVQSAFAQTGRASLTGVITDSQGAVVPGVTVTTINDATGVSAAVTTNQAGVYLFVDMLPGTYTVKAEKEGFRTALNSKLLLVAEQHAGMNITLQPGSVSEQVVVSAASQMLQTQSAELSTTINQRAINELPLNGRNPAELVFLTPGTINVLGTGAGALQSYTASPFETGASMNGGRQGSTYYLLDGAFNEDNYHLLAAPFPNPDATQEFSVINNNFDPRYGFTAGGVVSIVTKSGTNSWHGDVFEFARNGAFNAANRFTGQSDQIKRHQFGGSVGGPIVKDKLFFFGNYQGTRERYNVNSSETYVPSDAMRAGDFSGICSGGFDANGICLDRDPNNPNIILNQIWKPSIAQNRTYANALVNAYPNNYVDPSTFDPGSVGLTGLLPHTTDSLGRIPLQGYPHKDGYDEGTGRADYVINDHHRLSGRAFLNYYEQPAVSISLLNSDRTWVNHWQSYAGTHTWTISPTIVNSLTGSYVRMYDTSDSGLIVNGQPVCFSDFVNVNDITPGAPCSMFLDVEGEGPGGGFGTAQNHNEINRWTWSVSDSLSVSKGRHLLVGGIDVIRQFWYENTNWLALPLINFNGGPNGSFTGYRFSDFLLGAVSDFTQGAGESNRIHAWQIAPYIADQMKVTSHLTLSAGIRWEPFLAPVPDSGRAVVWAPGEQSTRYPNAPVGLLYPGDKGVPHAGMPSSYGYVNPRIGIAWQPESMPHTSIRAAYGIYSSQVDYSSWNHASDTAPFSPTYSFAAGTPQTQGITTPIIPFSDPWSVYQPSNYTSPFPPFSDPGFSPGSDVQFIKPVALQAGFARNFKPGITQTWNASVEQTFASKWLATFAYVGSHSYNQTIPIDMNPGVYNSDPSLSGLRPNQDFTSVLLMSPLGTANYNSGQFSVSRRYDNGFQFMANYTYSKALDDASFSSLAFTGSIMNPFCVPCNYGNSELNYPHKFIANFVYQVPTPASWARPLKATIGGWQISGIWNVQSGNPLTISSGQDTANAHVGSSRADFAPDNNAKSIHVKSGSLSNYAQYLDYTDFSVPSPGSFGNTPKNGAAAPKLNNWDMSLSKTFSITEQYRFQFRLEGYNAFNMTHWNDPRTNLAYGPATFGQIRSSWGERVAQVAGKFYF